MANSVVWATYTTCSVVVVLFGLFACVFMFMRQRRNQRKDDTEFFLTARRSVGFFFIGWSFFAAAMGSWTLFSPASYSYYAGILGLAVYAVSSGLPVLMIAFLGGYVHKLVPNVLSFTDFVYRRFGPAVQVYASLLMLFNMGVALTAEYTAVGDLFDIVIGAVRWPIVIIVGIVSAIYTAYGGLYVSIVTDQVQAFSAITMIVVLFIFVAATFDEKLPSIKSAGLGPSFAGYSSIAVLPISLASSTVFSEAMWQRCWATTTKRNLRLGGLIGFLAITICVFLLGFGGALAVWSGLYQPADANDFGNTALFSLLNNVSGGRKTGILVVVSILSVSMSTSAVDSLQNAVVDTISGVYLKRSPLIWVRLLVLVLNVPPMIISLKSYNIIQLFLVANLITTTSTLPMLSGLIPGRKARRIITPFTNLFGCLQGLISIFWWCAIDQKAEETYNMTLKRVFTVEYAYPPFLIALGMSVVGILVGAALEQAFRAVTRWPQNMEDPFAVEALPAQTKDTRDVDSEESDDAHPAIEKYHDGPALSAQ